MTHSLPHPDHPDTGGSATEPEPAEGLRLLKAFVTIADPKARAAAIAFVESLAQIHARDVR